jgi:hypothetical protein
MRRGHTQSTTARGYGHKNQQLRRRIARVVDAGQAYCSRCGKLIAPQENLDLDHTDDRRGYRGPSHRRCNQRAVRGLPPVAPPKAARALRFFDV